MLLRRFFVTIASAGLLLTTMPRARAFDTVPPVERADDRTRCPNWCHDDVWVSSYVDLEGDGTWDLAFIRESVLGGKYKSYNPQVTSQPPSEGYTEAWDVEFPGPAPDRVEPVRSVYIRMAGSGRVSGYAECVIRQSDPDTDKRCLVQSRPDGMPGVQVSIAFPASHWAERDVIIDHAMRMVNGRR